MKGRGVSTSISDGDIFSLFAETKDSMDSRENDEEYNTEKISWDDI
jgi:hypothetical protein